MNETIYIILGTCCILAGLALLVAGSLIIGRKKRKLKEQWEI